MSSEGPLKMMINNLVKMEGFNMYFCDWKFFWTEYFLLIISRNVSFDSHGTISISYQSKWWQEHGHICHNWQSPGDKRTLETAITDIQSHGPAPSTSQRIGDHRKFITILFSRNPRPSLVCQASYKWHISHFTLIQSLVLSISYPLMNISSGPGGLHSSLLITMNDHKGI